LIMGASLSAPGAGDKNDVSEIGNRKIAHRSIISQEKEVAIGKQLVAEIDRSAKLINDPTINAMTLPGGFVYVNSGVLVAADEEDQLAGVLAHEIAHAAARHWASQATRSTLLQYATLPLIFTPLSYPVYLGISQALNYGVPLTFLKFSRSAEAEAGFLGLQYMYKAGYDPNSYVTFFGKVLQEERGSPGSVPKVFLDHPHRSAL
jgi:beta-barrel assembly-enhancing protease